MSAKARDIPRRLQFRLRCARCGHLWKLELVATLFGPDGGLKHSEFSACPQCGVRKDHPDPARREQPELTGLEESSEWVTFQAF